MSPHTAAREENRDLSIPLDWRAQAQKRLVHMSVCPFSAAVGDLGARGERMFGEISEFLGEKAHLFTKAS